MDLDGATCHRFFHGKERMEPIRELTPSPSPRPITTSDRFFSSRIAQFRSEYHLKDLLKESHPFESVTHIDDSPVHLTPRRSISKLVGDQTMETLDRTATPTRRYSSSDIDTQSIHLNDIQNRQLIEQQKKRRIYNFNHTLFSNIYRRTHRSSSTDSPLAANRERQARHRHQSIPESEINDEHITTSDRAYSRALEKTILNPPKESHPYRTVLSVPEGALRRTSSIVDPSRQRSFESAITSDISIENGHRHSDQQKLTKINIDGNPRAKKLSFLSARRRASYYPSETSNILSDDQKRKRDVIWPLKRSYSFDTPFHREAIDALNKGKWKISFSLR